MKCPKSVFTNNHWVGWIGQNNFEWNSIIYNHVQCKQFQFVDSMLFGQVRLTLFSGDVEIFFREKSDPCTLKPKAQAALYLGLIVDLISPSKKRPLKVTCPVILLSLKDSVNMRVSADYFTAKRCRCFSRYRQCGYCVVADHLMATGHSGPLKNPKWIASWVHCGN